VNKLNARSSIELTEQAKMNIFDPNLFNYIFAAANYRNTLTGYRKITWHVNLYPTFAL
jgi:hypothetical protein